jgi:hypothetical protein
MDKIECVEVLKDDLQVLVDARANGLTKEHENKELIEALTFAIRVLERLDVGSIGKTLIDNGVYGSTKTASDLAQAIITELTKKVAT